MPRQNIEEIVNKRRKNSDVEKFPQEKSGEVLFWIYKF